jgi:hypothetical protein
MMARRTYAVGSELKNMRRASMLAAAFVIGMSVACGTARGQASLAEDDRDDITVQVAGKPETVTVLRDARRPFQWYYVIDTPRLYIRHADGKDIPQFSLLRYEITDPNNPQTPVQAGLLQFAATLEMPGEILSAVKAKLAQKPGLDVNALQLSALAIKSAEVGLYLNDPTNSTAKLIASSYEGAGMAPTFASQKMAFSIPLTANGADVYNAVVNSPTGVLIWVKLNYEGLTPSVGVKVSVNWDQAFHHYSSDKKFAARASYFGWFGASFNGEWQNIYNELTQNGDIKVEPILGNGFTQSDLEKVL